MQRSTDQMLSSHVGSLPRSAGVLAMFKTQHDATKIDPEKFQATVSEAVDMIVHKQVNLGLNVINDGEQSKWSYRTYVLDRLDGFDLGNVPSTYNPTASEMQDFPVYFERLSRPMSPSTTSTAPVAVKGWHQHICTGPISYSRFGDVDRDIANLKAATEKVECADVFMNSISPAMIWALPNQYYKDDDDYRHAICDALAIEWKRIVDAGIVLQIDSPDLTHYPRMVPGSSLEAHRRHVMENIEGINYATRNIDPEMLHVHVCHGAIEQPHHHDPDLAGFVDLLLQARPAGLSIVAANGRHEHEWQVWRDVKLPDGKVILPGVIDSMTNIIEHPDLVTERILKYASVLGKENVIASVDCGLATQAGLDQVDPDIAFAKLASLGEGTRRASDQLYG